MNSEQLKKINELIEEKARVEWCIKEKPPFENSYCDGENKVYLPEHIAESALITYRDELKAELKKLGYEE